MLGSVTLIPVYLYEDCMHTIPDYIAEEVKNCSVFFVEQEKTARRFLKKLWKEMVIDNYEWHTIHKAENEVNIKFINCLKAGKNIGILSEAGCPGIADPGQILVASAQQIGATIKPLVGPSSILLALMASGMNGQCFKFNGYLPIDKLDRKRKIKELEIESTKTNCTQIFIETPYRNNQLIADILESCKGETKFCIAIDLTSSQEMICTKTVNEWKKKQVDFHKKLGIFLISASN